MAIKEDYETRFGSCGPTWIGAIADTWPAYAGCMQYNDVNKEAILNLIAHLMVSATKPGTGTARNEASKSVGSVSVSYEALPAADNVRGSWFNTTRFGQVYWMLTGRRSGAVFV